MIFPIDWVATTIALVGMYILPTKKRLAICLFLTGNIIWLIWGYQTGHTSIIAYYVVMGCLNARTLIKWVQEAKSMKLQGAL